jgi:acyl dehydratase
VLEIVEGTDRIRRNIISRRRSGAREDAMTRSDEIETLGLGLHFEDFPVGRLFRTIGRTITEADLIAFINATGMTELLFTDHEFRRTESHINERIVPPALVYSLAEGLLIQAALQKTGLAFLQMELNVAGPTLIGDTVHVECEVIESRRSRSRPGRGLVRTRNAVVKQDGTTVLTYTPLRMLKSRSNHCGRFAE